MTEPSRYFVGVAASGASDTTHLLYPRASDGAWPSARPLCSSGKMRPVRFSDDGRPDVSCKKCSSATDAGIAMDYFTAMFGARIFEQHERGAAS